MSRTIKFRAWDKKEKKMCPVLVTNWEKGCFLIGNSPTPATLQGDFIVDGVEEGHFVKFDDLAMMQHTGKEDTNEKEVYEGDIIFNDDRPEHGVVKWSEEKAMFVTEYESGGVYPLWEGLSNLYNVVGNIYENPELLTHKPQ